MLPRKKGYQMSIKILLKNNNRIVLRDALSNDRSVLREQIAKLHRVFVETGSVVKVCRPAFAIGCEMRPSVMQAIRAEARK